MIRGTAFLLLATSAVSGCGGSTSDVQGPDAATPSDAGDAAVFDAATSSDVDADADAGPFCATPLAPDDGPASLDEVPWAAWCEATQGDVMEWTCEGRDAAVVIGDGGDCDRMYLFDATSHALIAKLEGCNGQNGCTAGGPDVQSLSACENGPLAVTNACASQGLADAAPDGAGARCTSNAQCPAGFVCGYFTNSPCASTGTCVWGDFANDPTCDPTTLCACDGTVTQACVGFVGGYALKPVPTRGQSATCDGG